MEKSCTSQFKLWIDDFTIVFDKINFIDIVGKD